MIDLVYKNACNPSASLYVAEDPKAPPLITISTVGRHALPYDPLNDRKVCGQGFPVVYGKGHVALLKFWDV